MFKYTFEKTTSKYVHTAEANGRKEGNVLFIDALNTFYLRLCGVGHMVKDHSDSEKGNPINSKSSFYALSHRQDSTYHGLCYTSRGALAEANRSSLQGRVYLLDQPPGTLFTSLINHQVHCLPLDQPLGTLFTSLINHQVHCLPPWSTTRYTVYLLDQPPGTLFVYLLDQPPGTLFTSLINHQVQCLPPWSTTRYTVYLLDQPPGTLFTSLINH